MPNPFSTTWNYADKHVDTNIDTHQFLASSRCLIYAAPTAATVTGNDGKTTTTTQNFKRIGVIQGWNWGENRQIEMIFELGSDIPYLVPGRTTGQISLSRIMLFGKDLANLIYSVEGGVTSGSTIDKADTYIKSIKEINKPFDLMFAAFSNAAGESQESSTTYSRVFRGCWIQSKNESISAGQILVAENVNIMYENIVSITVPENQSISPDAL